MINFENATFKDFENITKLNIDERSKIFEKYLRYKKYDDHQSYRIISKSGCSSRMLIESKYGQEFISLVSNDYLGFTQHPLVKEAAINGLLKYGTGAGASPLIGGFFDYHLELEKKIANFFNREQNSSVIYTTGYTANSASLQALLQKEDIAIIDSAVHTSVYEGCLLTNKKTYPHNDLNSLERILSLTSNKYRNKMVIVDGVYSQDGDTSDLKEIIQLCKKYQAYLMVDDAHGVGVLGATGRGTLEDYNLLNEVDFITGTFSKTFGNLGGYVITNSSNAKYLKFQSKQQIFSATANASSLGIIKAIDLIDEEPFWIEKLNVNIQYFKNGLTKMGINVTKSKSAIIPIKIGNDNETLRVATELLKRGVYTNPILYPAVSKKDSRIRTSMSASHSIEDLDIVLYELSKILG